jgi:hypothetical protein
MKKYIIFTKKISVMKKILLIVFVCIASVQLQAQNIQDIVSFDKFETWTNQIELEGLQISLLEESIDPNVIESKLYTVDFKNEESFLTISLMHINNFASYNQNEDEVYYQDGFRIIYITNDDDISYSILGLTNSDINSFVMLYAMPEMSKEEMISLFENIHIDKLFQ